MSVSLYCERLSLQRRSGALLRGLRGALGGGVGRRLQAESGQVGVAQRAGPARAQGDRGAGLGQVGGSGGGRGCMVLGVEGAQR